jgi:hypothetical protein
MGLLLRQKDWFICRSRAIGLLKQINHRENLLETLRSQIQALSSLDLKDEKMLSNPDNKQTQKLYKSAVHLSKYSQKISRSIVGF